MPRLSLLPAMSSTLYERFRGAGDPSGTPSHQGLPSARAGWFGRECTANDAVPLRQININQEEVHPRMTDKKAPWTSGRRSRPPLFGPVNVTRAVLPFTRPALRPRRRDLLERRRRGTRWQKTETAAPSLIFSKGKVVMSLSKGNLSSR